MLKMINWKSEQAHIGNVQASHIPFDSTCLEAAAPKYISFTNQYNKTLGKENCLLIASLYSKMNLILGLQREKYILSV